MSDEPAKDYAVTIRIKNNWMLKAMRAAGYETGKDLERASGVNAQIIYKFLSLKMPFMRDDGTWNPNAILLADTLGCSPDALVPPQHLKEVLAKNNGTFEANFDDVQNLIENRENADPLLLIEHQERSAAITHAMKKRLSVREASALIMKFGLDGEGERTYDEIGKKLGCGREGARQIEQRALRRMKVGGIHINPGAVVDMEKVAAAERLAEFSPERPSAYPYSAPRGTWRSK